MASPLPPTAAAPPSLDLRRWAALVVVCLAQLMNALDATIVNVALPSIQRDLQFSQANLTWVVNAYLITFGSFLLLAGRLGDLVGRKRVFLGGVLLFTASSAICALAQDQALLIAARFVQGIGGAVSSSVIVAIIVTEFADPVARARAMSVYVFVAVGGGSIGLLVGGFLTQLVNWHWIFFINLPIGAAALALGALLIRENQGIGLRQGVDVAGSVLVTIALMIGVYAIVGASDSGRASPRTLGFGGLAILLLLAFGVLESRLENPIMPLRILRLGGLTGSSAVRGLMAVGMFAAFFLGALYLEHVLGFGPTRTGLAFLPMTLTVGALSTGVTARLVGRFGPRRVLLPGLAATISGLTLLALAGPQAGYFPTLFAAFFLMGLGTGTSFLPLLTIAMADVPPQDAGLASGIVNVSMQISAAIGLAALGTISTDHTRALLTQGDSLPVSLTGGYQLAFAIAAATVAAGLLLAFAILRPRGGTEYPA
ncbi:MAG TPA: MFS transporter [Candidatus Binatia bacterium]|nr:MFS transporter [Candidatus Binatia bacterium]